MIEQSKSYGEQLIEWGREGALRPNLLPDEEGVASARLVQEELAGYFPDAEPVDDLHATLFYVKPREIYDYMVTNVSSDISDEWFYMDFANIFATAALAFRDFRLPVVGIARFGADESTVGLELQPTQQFRSYAGALRKLVGTALTRNGATENHLETMRGHAQYRWLFGELVPHVSLLANVGNGEIPKVTLPKSIYFNGLSDGSVQVPTDNPLRWYAIPGY